MSFNNEFLNFLTSSPQSSEALVITMNTFLQPAMAANPQEALPIREKPKRKRTAFTNAQLVQLEHEFEVSQYPNRLRTAEISEMLNLSERQVKVWFQNRRMKFKKDAARGASERGREQPAENVATQQHNEHQDVSMNGIELPNIMDFDVGLFYEPPPEERASCSSYASVSAHIDLSNLVLEV